MPKATLEFTLPEESEEHHDAINGWRYRVAIWAVDELLRKALKYENRELVPVDEVRKWIREELDDLPIP